MASLVVEGKLSKKKFEECYQSWKAHAAFGDYDGIIHDFDRQISDILENKN